MGSGPPFNWLGPQASPFMSLGCDFLMHRMGTTGHESLPVLMSTLVHWEGLLRMWSDPEPQYTEKHAFLSYKAADSARGLESIS